MYLLQFLPIGWETKYVNFNLKKKHGTCENCQSSLLALAVLRDIGF